MNDEVKITKKPTPSQLAPSSDDIDIKVAIAEVEHLIAEIDNTTDKVKLPSIYRKLMSIVYKLEKINGVEIQGFPIEIAKKRILENYRKGQQIKDCQKRRGKHQIRAELAPSCFRFICDISHDRIVYGIPYTGDQHNERNRRCCQTNNVSVEDCKIVVDHIPAKLLCNFTGTIGKRQFWTCFFFSANGVQITMDSCSGFSRRISPEIGLPSQKLSM